MGARRMVAALVAAALPGCLLLTGSTDGYQLVDAGSEGGACSSAADCAGDAGAQVCCLVLTSTSSAGSACAPQSCTQAPAVQLCKSDAECGNASCVSQTCTYGGLMVPIHACGNVPLCSP